LFGGVENEIQMEGVLLEGNETVMGIYTLGWDSDV
jgi:hypothetical protein